MKEKGHRLDRASQLVISSKLVSLAKEKFPKAFKVKNEGPTGPASMIATLVITCYKSETKKPMTNYLWNEFRISHEKIPNHGNNDNTLVLKLSELSKVSIKMIEDKFKETFPEVASNKVEPVVKNNDSIINFEAFNTKKPGSFADIRKIETNQLHATIFLNKILFFEKRYKLALGYNNSKKLFSYDKGKGDGYMTVLCQDESIAVIVEKALSWFVIEDNVVIRDGSDVMVNLSNQQDKNQKLWGISFCLPPDEDSSLEEIKDRITQVKKSCIPLSVVKIEGINAFKIDYARCDTASKIHLILSSMGWESAVDENFNLIVYTGPVTEKGIELENVTQVVTPREVIIELDEPKIDAFLETPPNGDKLQSTEEDHLITNEEENVITKGEENSDIHETELESDLIPDFINLPHSKEEALLYLYRLYQDRELFKTFPKEDQERIIAELEKTWIKEHAQMYSKKLLSFFN